MCAHVQLHATFSADAETWLRWEQLYLSPNIPQWMLVSKARVCCPSMELSVFIFSSGHFLQILLKEEGADISERYHVTVLGEIMLIKLKTIQLKKKSVSPDPRILYLHSIFSSLPRQIYSSIVTTTTHSALPYDSNIFLSSLYFVFRCIILRKINRQS